jgi:hypothetical protein
MRPPESLPARPGLAARLALGAAALSLAAAAAVYAWLRAFSTFRAYDDEGYFLVLVRHLLAGRAIYDDVPTVYGPAYLAYRWLLNGACGVPLGTDGVRWTTLAAWLAAVLLVLWITRLLTRRQRLSGWLALAASGFAVLHLYVLAHEPGHPHELGLLLFLGGLAGFAALRERRAAIAALVLGLAIGGLAATKLNLGVLLAPPALLAVLADERSGWRALRWPLLGFALVLPWLLMHAYLAEPWAQGLGAVAVAGVLSAFALSDPARRAERRLELGLSLAGAAAAVLVCVGFALLRGSSVRACTAPSCSPPRASRRRSCSAAGSRAGPRPRRGSRSAARCSCAGAAVACRTDSWPRRRRPGAWRRSARSSCRPGG